MAKIKWHKTNHDAPTPNDVVTEEMVETIRVASSLATPSPKVRFAVQDGWLIGCVVLDGGEWWCSDQDICGPHELLGLAKTCFESRHQ